VTPSSTASTLLVLPAEFGAVDRVTVSPSVAGFFILDDVLVSTSGLTNSRERVDFEDVTVPSAQCSEVALSTIAPTYHGLVWSQFSVRATGARCTSNAAAGDNAGTTSGTNMVYTTATACSISRPVGYSGTFGVVMVQAAGRSPGSSTGTMVGFRDNVQVATATLTVSSSTSTLVTLPAGFWAVDRVTVSGVDGLVLDDVTFDLRWLVPSQSSSAGPVVGEQHPRYARIGFDDLPPLPESCDSSAPVPAAYRGLKWDNAYYMGVCASRPAPPTGPNAAFNGTFRQYFLMGAVPLSVPRRLYAQVSILHDPAPCG
jgi:hypothetical protein